MEMRGQRLEHVLFSPIWKLVISLQDLVAYQVRVGASCVESPYMEMSVIYA